MPSIFRQLQGQSRILAADSPRRPRCGSRCPRALRHEWGFSPRGNRPYHRRGDRRPKVSSRYPHPQRLRTRRRQRTRRHTGWRFPSARHDERLRERVGNCNLTTIIPTLQVKMGLPCVPDLTQLREVSRFIDELANVPQDIRAPYVGQAAFTHKGGLHVHAVQKFPTATST